MIDILMATYNGEKYLKEQINSLLNQDYSEWILYIRDDGSKDNTINIINEYASMNPEKIIIVKDDKQGLGAKMNFAELMKFSKNQYCMFCDQDDIWLNNKISISLCKMKELEEKYGQNEPILVHSDLNVVDENLNIINKSFWKHMNFNPNRNSLNNIMVENVITGCTAMMNRALINFIGDVPKECFMHDWWIGLVASSFGKIGIINEATILYRQHGSNQLGANKETYITRLKNKFKNKSVVFSNELAQMEKFYEVYNAKFDNKCRKIAVDFITMPKKNFFMRRYLLIRNKIFLNNIISNIKNIIFI